MSASIRFGFIDWLQRISNQIAKHLMQKLRRPQMKTDAIAHYSNALVIGINHATGEGQRDNAVGLTRFCNQINEFNRHVIVNDIPPFAANSDLASGLFVSISHQKNLLKNQNISIGRNYATDSQSLSSVGPQAPAHTADDKGRSAEEFADRPTEQGGGDD